MQGLVVYREGEIRCGQGSGGGYDGTVKLLQDCRLAVTHGRGELALSRSTDYDELQSV